MGCAMTVADGWCDSLDLRSQTTSGQATQGMADRPTQPTTDGRRQTDLTNFQRTRALICDPCKPSLPHKLQVPLPHLQLEAAPRESPGTLGRGPGSIVPLRWPAASPSTSQAMPHAWSSCRFWPSLQSFKRESWSRSRRG